MRIPLFPLNSVLFPGGSLSLRVFEPRYLRMVGDCLQEARPFGVCLIRKGTEVGPAAEPAVTGTLGHIVDWDQRRDGLLGITVRGGQRFEIVDYEVSRHQLLQAEVRLLEDPACCPLAAEFGELQGLLRRILEQLGPPYTGIETQYDDAHWVACRLAEILPLPLKAKQELLELDDPLERLTRLRAAMVRAPGG